MIQAGNNGKKTEYIKKTLEAGINVLSDKPMAINSQSFKLLEECCLLYTSLRQQTLRTLTAVSALYAHQLRPEIEPDGSSGIANAACSFVIPHQVREQACPRACLLYTS